MFNNQASTDQRTLATIGGFRAGSAFYNQEARNPAHSRKRNPLPWVDQYTPVLAVGDTPLFDTIRLIPGDYLMQKVVQKPGLPGGEPEYEVVETRNWFYSAIEHYDQLTKKFFFCTGGPWYQFSDRREPCHGCDQFDAEWEKTGGDLERHARRRVFMVSVFDYGRFFQVDSVNKKTNQISTDKEGKPYKEWKKFYGRGKPSFHFYDNKDGHLMHWKMGGSNWTQLTSSIMGMVSRTCTMCGQRDQIETQAWACPKCENPIMDLSGADSDLDQSVIDQRSTTADVCPTCGEIVVPIEVVSCLAGCNGAQRTMLLDVDLNLSATAAKGVNKKGHDISASNWVRRQIPEKFLMEAVSLKLNEIYRTDTLEQQMEKSPITDGKEIAKAYKK